MKHFKRIGLKRGFDPRIKIVGKNIGIISDEVNTNSDATLSHLKLHVQTINMMITDLDVLFDAHNDLVERHNLLAGEYTSFVKHVNDVIAGVK